MAQQNHFHACYGRLLCRSWKFLAFPISLLQVGRCILLHSILGLPPYDRYSSCFDGACFGTEVLAWRYRCIQRYPPTTRWCWSCFCDRFFLHRCILQRHHCLVSYLPGSRIFPSPAMVGYEHSRRQVKPQTLPRHLHHNRVSFISLIMGGSFADIGFILDFSTKI